MHTKSKIIDIVARIIIAVGIIVGIIFTAVGSTMVVNSGLKLAFFDTPRYTNLTWELDSCNDIEYAIAPAKSRLPQLEGIDDAELQTQIANLTADEREAIIEDCKETARENAQIEFHRGESENIINGLSSIFVGLLLWVSFGIWGRKVRKAREEGTEEADRTQ